MAISIAKKFNGSATNPSVAPIGVKGNRAATATTANEVPASKWCGRLAKGLKRVRMTNITRTYGADS